MRKEASIEAWKKLYDITLKLKELEPWNLLGDTDLIAIVPKGRKDPVFCSVMGKYSGSQGIAVFEGYEGLGDFYMIAGADESDLSSEYLMNEQSSLTCFVGSMMNVPEKQREVIDQLDLRFKNIESWVYFFSYKKGYQPYILDADETELLTEVYENLYMAVQAVQEGKLAADFAQGEGIVRKYNEETEKWEMFVKEIPVVEKEFPAVMLEDEQLKASLKERPMLDLTVLLDFTYLPVSVETKEGERPKNPLMFMAFDDDRDEIITMDVLEEEDDEISRALGFFISFTQQHGRIGTIKARNPWIFGALEDICEYCGVQLVYHPVEKLEAVREQVIQQL